MMFRFQMVLVAGVCNLARPPARQRKRDPPCGESCSPAALVQLRTGAGVTQLKAAIHFFFFRVKRPCEVFVMSGSRSGDQKTLDN